jgi:zinc transporter 1/2/3
MKAFKSNKVVKLFELINQMVLAFSTAFSGGLFLSVGLLHLLPEANENFDKYWES